MPQIGTSESALVPMALVGLPRAHLSILREFAQAGGIGEISRQGRIIAGTPPRPMAGDFHAWLDFVRRGLLEGDGEHLRLTKAGRAIAAQMAA